MSRRSHIPNMTYSKFLGNIFKILFTMAVLSEEVR